MSGWTTITVEANSEQDAEELADHLRPICEFDDDVRISDTEIRGLSWGHDTHAPTILKEYPTLWSEAVVMDCNDTSDSGSGMLYRSDGTSVEKVDHEHGVEGARGHDAAMSLATEYIDRPYMR